MAAVSLLVFVVCGALLAVALGAGLSGLGAGRTDETAHGQSAAQSLSLFFLGVSFTPFVLAQAQLALLIVLAELPHWILAGAMFAGCAFFAWSLRRRIADVGLRLRQAVTSTRGNGVGAAVVAATLLLVLAFAGVSMLKPLWHGDALIYAVEAKAMHKAASYTARLEHTPAANADNYIRNNDHPITYIGLFNAGWSFGVQTGNDLPLRAALQTQNLCIVLALVGLSLQFGGWVAVFASVLLLFAHYFGALIDMSAREGFRIVPVLLLLGLAPQAGQPLRLVSWRSLVIGVGWLFLWSSHSGSIAVAPLLLVCMLPWLSGWRSRAVMCVLFGVGFLLGGSHLLLAYLKTGHPLGFEFVSMQANYITERVNWSHPAPPQAGLSSIPTRFVNQVNGDGVVAVAVLLVGVAAVLLSRLRGRETPPAVTMTAWFALLNELQVLGLFDWISPGFGNGLYTVGRYRFILYPLGSFLLSYYIVALFNARPWRFKAVAMPALAAVLFACGAVSAGMNWQRTPLEFMVGHNAYTLQKLDPVKSCWAAVALALNASPHDRPVVILTDSPYIPWYYTDLNVIALADEKLYKARMTADAAVALAEIDRLGITHIVMNKFDVLSGTALGMVADSPQFTPTLDCVFDWMRTRTPMQK